MPGSDDRQPSAVDRPPASRVGDELQKLADGATGVAVDSEGPERLEAEAVERARHSGWDSPLDDVDPPGDASGPATQQAQQPELDLTDPDLGRGAD